MEKLNNDTFTFISNGFGHCKWLDHVVGKSVHNMKFKSINVLTELIGSDHLPLVSTVSLPLSARENIQPRSRGINDFSYVDWSSLNVMDLERISNNAAMIQTNFLNDNDVICLNEGCSKDGCLDFITNFYDVVVKSVEVSSSDFLKSKLKKDKFDIVPGWNRNVKDKYKDFRQKYAIWLDHGKPRDSSLFDNLKVARSEFKRALDHTLRNRNNEILLSIQEKFTNKDMKKFWKEVRKKKGGASSAGVIDGQIDDYKIVEIFFGKFLSSNSFLHNSDSSQNLNNYSNNSNICVSNFRVRELVKNLNKGCGHDDIHSLLLLNASDLFIDNITYFLNLCFRHRFIPSNLLKGEISPIVKDKKGNKNDSANYRPIMQSSNLLKIFETHVLNILEDKLCFDSKQFGFTKNTSTTDACFLLKETVHRYISKKSTVFANFIDLSKAFDLVNHKKLINILLDKGVPIDIIKLIKMYLENQSACVVWNGKKSNFVNVGIGVRQGGILSPLLFKVYIDGIIRSITKLGIGCKLGFSTVNIICYADDVVLLATSLEDLNTLYSTFNFLISNLNLKININKSKVMLFYMKNSREIRSHIDLNNGCFEVVKQYLYLGNMISHNLDDMCDVKFKLNTFYSSFHSTIRSFNGVNLDTMIHLFNAYCAPQYGLTLWNSFNVFNKQYFKSFEIAYNNSIKQMIGCPKYASSHLAAEVCHLLLLKHKVGVVQLKYYHRIINSFNSVIFLNKNILKCGYFCGFVFNNFSKNYNVNISRNPLCACISRVNWVQTHEPRGRFCSFFNR